MASGDEADCFMDGEVDQKAGKWELISIEGESDQVLKVSGDGFFSAGAFEDDDLLYDGAGPKFVKFAIKLSVLNEQYSRT